MKQGTAYAARLAKEFAALRRSLGEPEIGEADDPLRRLAIAVLSAHTTEAKAEKAIDRARSTMVDWNELRVSTPDEIDDAMGNAIPGGRDRCKVLATVLRSIFERENRVALDKIEGMPRREAKQYLESLDGVDAHAAASVILWSLGGHAIPVSLDLLKALRLANLVHPRADRAEVQAFLERNVAAADAKAFCILMSKLGTKRHPSTTRNKKTTARQRNAARRASTKNARSADVGRSSTGSSSEKKRIKK